jgi:hypothetical protein
MRFRTLPIYVGLILTLSYCLTQAGEAQDIENHPGATHPLTTLSNFNEITTGWQQCTGSCAGGTNPSATFQDFHITNPSLDDQAMELGLTGPVSCQSPCNTGPNNGWYYDTGAADSNTTFELIFWFYAPSNTDVVSREFDQFQYLLAGDGGATKNTRLYWGTQCVTGGHWDVWNSYSGSWVDTGKTCSYGLGVWNKLDIKVHRVSGDTSCSGGYPCMYYDYAKLTPHGGSTTTIFSNEKTSAGALPAGWGEQTGFMIQLDGTPTCLSSCTITEYIDEGSFTY